MKRLDKSIHGAHQKALCRILQECRAAAELRQEDVAASLGRPQSFVSKYESGERRLDIIELRAVCEALGTDLQRFVAQLEAALQKLRKTSSREH